MREILFRAKQVNNGEWVCTNDLSEYYALETDYSDACVDYEGRE